MIFMKLKFLLSFQIFAVFKITALKLFFNAENIFCSEKIKQTESLKHDYIGLGFHFSKNRSTRAKMFYKIGVPKMFAKFTGNTCTGMSKFGKIFQSTFFSQNTSGDYSWTRTQNHLVLKRTLWPNG